VFLLQKRPFTDLGLKEFNFTSNSKSKQDKIISNNYYVTGGNNERRSSKAQTVKVPDKMIKSLSLISKFDFSSRIFPSKQSLIQYKI